MAIGLGAEPQDVKRRLMTNTVVAYAGTGIAYTAGLVFTPYLIRELGTAAYGVATLLDIFTIAGWMSLLDLGIQSSATKYAAESAAEEDWEEVSRVVSTTFALFMLIGGTVALFLLLASGWLAHHAFNIPVDSQNDLLVALQVLAIALAIQFPGLAITAAVEGTQRGDVITIVRTATTLLGTVVAVGLVASGQGLLAYLIVIVVAPAAGVLILAAWFVRFRKRIAIRPHFVSRDVFGRLMRLSRQVVAARLAGLMLLQTDRIVIGALLSAAALTQYAIAARIYAVVFLAGVLMNSAVVAPASHYAAVGNQAGLQGLFLRGTKYAMIVSLSLGAATFAVAPELCVAWVGEPFRGSGLTVQIWLLSAFVPALTGVGSLVLMGIDRMQHLASIWIAAAALNIAISIPGALLWGVDGVVLGTTIAYLAVVPSGVGLVLRTLDLTWSRLWSDTVLPTLPWIVVAGVIAFGGVGVVGLDDLPSLLFLILVAETCALVGFLWVGIGPGERASLLRRPRRSPAL